MAKNKELSNKGKELSTKRKCPEGLGKLIFDVSSIPEKIALRDYNEIWREYDSYPPDDLTKEETYSFILEEQKQIFNECFVSFSEQFKENFLRQCEAAVVEKYPNYDKLNLKIASLYLAIDDYQILYRLNTDLRSIARFFSHLRKGSYRSASESELITNDGESIRLPTFEVQLKRDGTIGKVHKGLSEAVIGVDLDRIRTCEICSRIFWAKRTESSTCSPQHYETLKKRRARSLTDEEKEERKAKRAAIQKSKKEQKEGKEKIKNGTL